MKKHGWKELPAGAVLPGEWSTERFPTGDWRTEKPIWDETKCTQCLLCYLSCPDSSIKIDDGKMVGINYKFCKGCGLCASVCPPKAKAITMVREGK